MVWLFVVTAMIAVVLIATPAQAAFPGGNGKLALEHSQQGNLGLSLAPIPVVNSDGTDYGLLPIAGGHPQRSPDGSRLAYSFSPSTKASLLPSGDQVTPRPVRSVSLRASLPSALATNTPPPMGSMSWGA